LLDLNDNKELLLKKLKGNNIIVDKVGYLIALYRVGNIAYVGGGFGRGIHSIVEPAGYGLPIICGGNIQNSTDAMRLSEIGALFEVQNEDELSTLLTNLMNEKFYESVSIKVKTYFIQRIGATDRIVNDIMTFLTKPKK
jgi:3-deoxy-D-manno-octulosonic-acid transferase